MIRRFFQLLFSRVFLMIYGVVSVGLTILQIVMIFHNKFPQIESPNTIDGFGTVVELFMETLIPIWADGISVWDLTMIFLNLTFTILILFTLALGS